MVYTVHIYDPHVFSHQGARWDARVTGVTGLYYPTDRVNCDFVKTRATSNSKKMVEQYCLVPWNKKRIEHQVKLAHAWSKRHHVPLWIGEFGVYPKHAPPENAFRYLRDLRLTFEKYGMEWCVWEYVEWLDRLQSEELRDALGLYSH